MGVEVSVHDLDGAVEVVLTGDLNQKLLATVGEALVAIAEPGQATILNLDDATVVDPETLEGLVVPLTEAAPAGPVGIVCGQAGLAEGLRRWAHNRPVSIYPSLSVALARATGRSRPETGRLSHPADSA